MDYNQKVSNGQFVNRETYFELAINMIGRFRSDMTKTGDMASGRFALLQDTDLRAAVFVGLIQKTYDLQPAQWHYLINISDYTEVAGLGPKIVKTQSLDWAELACTLQNVAKQYIKNAKNANLKLFALYNEVENVCPSGFQNNGTKTDQPDIGVANTSQYTENAGIVKLFQKYGAFKAYQPNITFASIIEKEIFKRYKEITFFNDISMAIVSDFELSRTQAATLADQAMQEQSDHFGAIKRAYELAYLAKASVCNKKELHDKWASLVMEVFNTRFVREVNQAISFVTDLDDDMDVDASLTRLLLQALEIYQDKIYQDMVVVSLPT